MSCVKRLFWKDVRETIKNLDPLFSNLVDEVSPSNRHPVYILKFPYAAIIGDKISQFIPSEKNGYIRLNSNSISSEMKKELGYGAYGSPLGMLISKTMELYVDIPEKQITLPVGLLYPGDFYNFTALFRKNRNLPLTPNGILCTSAGARTVFSLPNLKSKNNFNKMRNELGFNAHKPSSLYEHWNLFKDISDSVIQKEPWCLEIMYFSEQWVKDITSNASWGKISKYLTNLAWIKSEYHRNQFYLDISFSLIRNNINRSDGFELNTIRYLFDILSGAYPGLAPVEDNEKIPIKLIQHVLKFSYGINKYTPTIVAPQFYDYRTESKGVYYSLQYPTATSISFDSNTKNTKSTNLHNIQDLLTIVMPLIKGNGSAWQGTLLQDAISKTSIDFIHSENHIDKQKLIFDEARLSDKSISLVKPSVIACKDNRFSYSAFSSEPYDPSSVCLNAKFFKGCIRFSGALK